MKKFEEMSKSEMEAEIAFTKDFVNNEPVEPRSQAHGAGQGGLSNERSVH